MARTLNQIIRDLQILDISGDDRVAVADISYDSRQIHPGGLFVALPGAHVDGARFVADAVARGARAVVSETAQEKCPGVTFIRVPDSRKAMACIAADFFDHPSRAMTMIGVTGTNGKTTTTLLIESILKKCGFSVGVLGTLAYRWAGKMKTAGMTTPQSLDLQRLLHEMCRDGVTHVVMEVSSHALALGRVDQCNFHAAVFTNLSQDHLDFHSTMEDYFAAKATLFTGYMNSDGKSPVAVINEDDPYGKRLIGNSQREVWSYSMERGNGRVRVLSAELTASGIDTIIASPSGELRIRTPLIGRLNLYNVLTAAATGAALGVPGQSIVDGIEAVTFVDGRLQRVAVPDGRGYAVVVDYAHTPDAMEKSLACLKEMTKGRLLVVFGCGGDRDRGKRPLMGKVAGQLGDLVVLTSDNPRSEIPDRIIEDIEPGVLEAGLSRIRGPRPGEDERGYTVEGNRRKAIELALRWARSGDTVFVGGKGHETYQIIGSEVFPFDDRLVVQEYFKRMNEASERQDNAMDRREAC